MNGFKKSVTPSVATFYVMTTEVHRSSSGDPSFTSSGTGQSAPDEQRPNLAIRVGVRPALGLVGGKVERGVLRAAESRTLQFREVQSSG